jgi:hypothetical protein
MTYISSQLNSTILLLDFQVLFAYHLLCHNVSMAGDVHNFCKVSLKLQCSLVDRFCHSFYNENYTKLTSFFLQICWEFIKDGCMILRLLSILLWDRVKHIIKLFKNVQTIPSLKLFEYYIFFFTMLFYRFLTNPCEHIYNMSLKWQTFDANNWHFSFLPESSVRFTPKHKTSLFPGSSKLPGIYIQKE